MSCNFDMIQCFSFSEDETVCQHVPFLLQRPHALWVRVSVTCLTQEDKKTKNYSTSSDKVSLTALSMQMKENFYNSCKIGGLCGRSTASRSPSHLTNANKQPIVLLCRIDFAWTNLLNVMPAPSCERVSKHVPLPCGPAVNQQLKDTKTHDKRQGNEQVRKVKKSKVKFERVDIETETINRMRLSLLLLIL